MNKIMGSNNNNVVICAVLGMLAILQFAEAQTRHVVGGSEGWKIPSNDSEYQDWANNQRFSLGDILVFDFTMNQHDVVEVPKDSYDICSPENAINTTMNSPANFILNKEGQFYYICSFGTHCIQGQKLSIIVPSSSSGAPSPQPSRSPPVVTTAASFTLIFILAFMGF
ncbi:hypothetical protein HN51_020932 [Arachis hypogaea]|uniref:Phytocyanin domain-containing protein n=1 Tax=Arachis hypogaea TaxID=3818 RepID=A0A445EIM2_ARAHY|nr:umecyanin [Arachis hypogaea]QHO51795.1 Umecyanin [Arachis hypogaea]RYR75309.1 hypothetical protein Ahy_A02g009964 [Arachis hypogaea]